MPEMNEVEVRERLKAEVKDFIEKVKSEGHPMPTTTVVRLGGGPGTYTEEPVANPSRVLRHYTAHEEGENTFFRDLAEWLWESGNGWELSLSDQDGDPIEDPSKDQVVPHYENDLLVIACTVMDIYGGFGYSDEAFDWVFENKFKPKYQDGREYEVIVPLLNFNGPDETIELNPDIDIKLGDDHHGRVRAIEIEPFTEREISGIYTWASTWPTMHMGGGGFRGMGAWSHKIQLGFEIDAGTHGGLENLTVDRILTALRLFKQSTNDVAAGARFRPRADWLDVREDIMRIGSAGWSHSSPALRGRQYVLDENESEDFIEFWDDHRHQFNQLAETAQLNPTNSAVLTHLSPVRRCEHQL